MVLLLRLHPLDVTAAFVHQKEFHQTPTGLCPQEQSGHAPERADELAEGGSAVRLVGPAAGEQAVDLGGTLLWFGKANSRLQLVDHLTVFQPEERLLGHRENLPDAHAYKNTNKSVSILRHC